ncbi:GRF zinc finger containing protein [Corchorus olitorius]|uniref:GRF zinc finger containing protein n=1 Tax=Corchorus olitorius TaxID=93759 RepID=A0A1R3I5R4_9ROSI|nr:GRF zinc finger containing protein [Corchorus olitorius]
MAHECRSAHVSSSQAEYVYDGEPIFGQCKQSSPKNTSRTDENPGRRFHRWVWKTGEWVWVFLNGMVNGCGFFEWYDSRMPKRVRNLLLAFRDIEWKFTEENATLRWHLESLGVDFHGLEFLVKSTDANVDNETKNVDFGTEVLY